MRKNRPVRCPMVSGSPTAAWVGRIFEERYDVHGEQRRPRDQGGGGPGAEGADAAEGVAEDECRDAADGDAEDEDAGGETAGGLHRAADQLLTAVVVVAVNVAVGLLQGDGRVHARLTEEVGDEERRGARDKAREHAAEQERSNG